MGRPFDGFRLDPLRKMWRVQHLPALAPADLVALAEAPLGLTAIPPLLAAPGLDVVPVTDPENLAPPRPMLIESLVDVDSHMDLKPPECNFHQIFQMTVIFPNAVT